MMSMKRTGAGAWAAWALSLLLALISAAPILWIVATSFKTFIQTQAVPPVWPNFANFDNYVSQFTGDSAGLGALIRSLIIASVATLVTIALAVPAAYSLARYRLVRKGDIQFWIISSRMMPLIAGVVPLAALLQAVHLFDTVPGLIIVYVGINLSFAVWLLSIFFQGVPIDVEQAAHIDGLTRFGVMVVHQHPARALQHLRGGHLHLDLLLERTARCARADHGADADAAGLPVQVRQQYPDRLPANGGGGDGADLASSDHYVPGPKIHCVGPVHGRGRGRVIQ